MRDAGMLNKSFNFQKRTLKMATIKERMVLLDVHPKRLTLSEKVEIALWIFYGIVIAYITLVTFIF